MLTYLELGIDGHADEGKAEKTRSLVRDVILHVLRQLAEENYEHLDCREVTLPQLVLYFILHYPSCMLSFL